MSRAIDRLPTRTKARANRATPLGDLRFRALLDHHHWQRLPGAVRTRFSHKAGPGETFIYVGVVTEMFATRLGRALVHLCTLIGGPLPMTCAPGDAACVMVTEDARGGGQTWTRIYASKTGFPQAINSAKRFAGETGLEEHIGAGLGMSLTLAVEDHALVFKSHRYFWTLGRLRVPLPTIVTPGQITVRHIPLSENAFLFTLNITHPWFGAILRQAARFEDMA